MHNAGASLHKARSVSPVVTPSGSSATATPQRTFPLRAAVHHRTPDGTTAHPREPADLARTVAHAGVEFRPAAWIIPLHSLGGFRFIAATDVKSSKEHDWKPSMSARAGVEYEHARDTAPAGRRWALLAECYEGPSPYGQFFRERVRYSGIGIHFSGF